jgi:hypothetical protein
MRCDGSDELGDLWKDAFMDYFKASSWCLLVSTKENHEISVRIANLWLRFIAG